MARPVFRASPLPKPPPQYDSRFFTQFLRTLEVYFAQLSSISLNNAKNGGTIYSGAVAPTDTIGSDGDYYFDTVTKILYGPKDIAGMPVWPVALT
jgi:hypothetical protein